MMRSLKCAAILCALCIPIAAHAAATPEVSAFAMPAIAGPEAAVHVSVAANVAQELGAVFAPGPGRTEYESVRYRPRRERVYRENYGRGPQPASVSELHLGFFDPEGDESNGVVFGGRLGLQVDPHIAIGGDIDWHHKSDRQTEIVSTGPGPGGQDVEVRRELARSSSNLFPILGYLQINADPSLSVIPYFGIAGGYEALFISAEDFQTGEDFDGTFDGFGWQAWAGAAMPLSGRSRLNAEIFINQAELGRDVDDAITGETFRETVTQNGAGMRVGLSWGF
jgi:hypothetical protein